jgi:hypothetical protein
MSAPRYTVDDFNDIPGLEPGRNGAGPDRDSWLPLNLADLPDQPRRAPPPPPPPPRREGGCEEKASTLPFIKPPWRGKPRQSPMRIGPR